MTENTTNLYLKMAKILGEVQRIPKNGFNTHFKYSFTSEGDITDAIREHLSKNNIALFSSMKHWEQTPAGNTIKTICDFEFTLVCADTGMTHVSTWSAEANDSQDKGFNKAATAAMKYWLLKTFMIPTGDDPDADNHKDDKKKKQGDKWPTAELVGELIKRTVERLEVTANEISKYTGIANLDDLSAWEKYADRATAAKAIKAAHDKHMVEIAASKPATPKAPQPYIEDDLHKAVLNTVYAGNEHHMKRSIAKMLADGELKTTMTLEQAVKAIEEHKAAKLAEEAQKQAAKITADETRAKLNSGGEKRLGGDDPDPFEDKNNRLDTLKRLEGEAVDLYEFHTVKAVQGRGKVAGDKRVAYASIEENGSKQRIDVTLFPEDVEAIRKKGHYFPQVDGPISIPVILHIENGIVRINRDLQPEKEKVASPFGKKQADNSQQLFDDLPGMSQAAKNQLERA